MLLSLSLNNSKLYAGIQIYETGGKLSIDLTEEALNKIGENVEAIIKEEKDRTEITLTGAAPIPVYLVVFHIVVHRFKKVYYDNEMYNLLIARH
ncbi:MAG: hypothetical protein PHV30_06910 [Candidatus Margulisbacteria bacterium]|nr:hypothetical protein [Candidatus Margulisiibacteriota bacterium]